MSHSVADRLSRLLLQLNPFKHSPRHQAHPNSLGLIRWEMVRALSIRRISLLVSLMMLLFVLGGIHGWIPVVMTVHIGCSVVAWLLSRKPNIHRTVFVIGTLIDPLFIAILLGMVAPDPILRISIYCFFFAFLVNTLPLMSSTISNLTCLTTGIGFVVAGLVMGLPQEYLIVGGLLLFFSGFGNFNLINAMLRGYRGTMHYYGRQKNRREKLAKSSKEKADFLANMNHELRTPLNGIIGMTGLLMSSPLPPEQEEYARTIRSSAELLLALINDILDMSRAEAGQLLIEHRPFELGPVINLVVDNLKASARDKGISLSIVYATSLPRVIVGDANRINQILFNLVGNAIKFTNYGRVCITVSIHPDPIATDKTRQMLRLAISDTGTGIPAAELENIFDKYRQASVDIVRRFGGTGLGLAITRELVSRMNGNITVSSEVGKGSVFTAIIPCVVAETEELPPITENTPSRMARSTILLADDNPVNLSLLGRMTRNFGCQTREVRDGQEALSAFKQMAIMGKVDLAIIDYQMPGLNGREVVEELRIWEKTNHFLPIPVVILTGHLGSLIEPDFEPLLAVEIVEKPVRIQQLKSIVDKYLNESDLRQGQTTR